MVSFPNLYVYFGNNPSESSLANRKGYSTLISHNVPPYGISSMYGQLDGLKTLVWNFKKEMNAAGGPELLSELQRAIEEKVVSSGLNIYLGSDHVSQ